MFSLICAFPRSEEHTSELQSLTNLVCRLCLRSEEHTSELQSLTNLVCRLLLETEEHTSELQSLTNLVCRLLLGKKYKLSTFALRAALVVPEPVATLRRDAC